MNVSMGDILFASSAAGTILGLTLGVPLYCVHGVDPISAIAFSIFSIASILYIRAYKKDDALFENNLFSSKRFVELNIEQQRWLYGIYGCASGGLFKILNSTLLPFRLNWTFIIIHSLVISLMFGQIEQFVTQC